MSEFSDYEIESAKEAKYGLSPLQAMTDEELVLELKLAEESLLQLELGAIASGESTPDQLVEDSQKDQRLWDLI